MSYSRFLPDEQATIDFGRMLIRAVCQIASPHAITLYLNGDLGAGKTTLSRGMIQGLGHQGNVKSPTYTLVEEYRLQGKRIYHFDLYRLSDPEELEFMGIRDYFSADSICLIEWAEKGASLLAEPDLSVNISYTDNARRIELIPQSEQGEAIIQLLK
ncbi:tRNA (adenosine(37)-N6)-threonylcarbamoyltransferase complex ATPase subunit type 1 TsaE [Bisgaard Taxon 10/6]|uniref:tRNA (adenosine(37)-N6)-threonylcarbamoyltransferase complex ATPase subunit type 1 TsaE n=1 Tax=Exercitatus varius TaxID=67857 RepID=UPI00294AE76A|nr:tRNA (adenosine(37)-N6)-threonylcarbamoyltransferase complex ATPase subunit type 1 TsaE [Exercitatus varius]MDG2956750.1 tRNA (adenosine(37)-N6)-threonylcarbamoyltransferase complex ATPase subunit type 1 TsaE [Exercitatus varius]MDG2964883.1 tRNA (adenosine(37)-N6)-threonylcarbamoyltransferase complex ATPase subunit type 1 TsaE [Exercitatus varius]